MRLIDFDATDFFEETLPCRFRSMVEVATRVERKLAVRNDTREFRILIRSLRFGASPLK